MMINTSDKILEAADELFAKNGFDATSIRDIAEISGINKALVHYHFKNKEDLLLCVLDRYYEKLFKVLQEALQKNGSFKERIYYLIETYFDFLKENLNFSKIVQREASGGKNVNRITSHMIPFFKMGTAMISNIYPVTKSGDLAAEQILVSFYGMIVSYFSYSDVIEPLIGSDPLSEENLAKRKSHLKKMFELLFAELES